MPDLDVADMIADALAEASSVLEAARAAGEQYVPALFVQREDERVALCLCPQNSRERVLALAQLSAIGFQPSHIVLVMDTWQTPRGLNPVTGEPWQYGEMADLAEHHDGIAKGWVSEALSAVMVDRKGSKMLWELPYRVTDDVIAWSPPELMEGAGGPLPDMLAQIMSAIPEPPPPDPLILAKVGEEMVIAGRDCATARHIIDGGDIAALAFIPGSRRGRVIRAMFPDGEATNV